MEAALRYAIENKSKSVTVVHKGNIMKFTEGSFRNWSFECAETQFAITPTLGINGKKPKSQGVNRLPMRAGRGAQGRTNFGQRCDC